IDCDRAVAVLRGWLPRTIGDGRESAGRPASVDLRSANGGREADEVSAGASPASSRSVGYDAVPSVPIPPESETVEGRLLSYVPRLFELGSLTGRQPESLTFDGQTPVVQNLNLDVYAAATGLELLPAVLQQTGGDNELIRDWAGPAVDVEKNLGYALQWFSFAAIAL